MVFNDLLLTVDTGNYVVLVLLDLAVAFNTIDLSVLFSRLDDVCGVQCKVLKWFKSYLTGRSMLVNIRASISAYDDHVWCASRLRLCSCFTLSLYNSFGKYFKKCNIAFHCCTDDVQVNFPLSCENGLELLPACFLDLKPWKLWSIAWYHQDLNIAMCYIRELFSQSSITHFQNS